MGYENTPLADDFFVRAMTNGTCKLTRTQGRFVKSHLIPKSLTRPAKSGMQFIEYGHGSRPIRRCDSWYDPELVTQPGENILTVLDTWAVSELRKHRLVWSGWGPMQALSHYHDHAQIPGTPWGIRKIIGIDPGRLRLFFLSLLWRAAASSRREFSEIQMPGHDLERLRIMLVQNDPAPLAFYPAVLTQLSTRGEVQNHTPISDLKTIPATEDAPEHRIPIFRFYFDGLIAHIHCQSGDSGETARFGPLVVGAEDTLAVSTVTYETSFQRENLELLKLEATSLFSDVMHKF